MSSIVDDIPPSDWPIAYGWPKSKAVGGGLIIVCAECYDNGRGYTGSPRVFYAMGRGEPFTRVFCKKEVQW